MAKAPAVLKMTSAEIRKAMLKRWADPEYAILWEVGEATGAGSGRYADAVIMSLWPSRGLELHGIEIKVSRSDWRREAADPEKAEAVAKYCDRWYVHTPKGLIQDVSELPPAWGLRECDGVKWVTIKEAEKTEAAAVTRGFLAAMLRRADRLRRAMIDEGIREAWAAQAAEAEKRRASFNQEVERAAERRLSRDSDKIARLEAFEAAFGNEVFGWGVDCQSLGAAARTLAEARGFGGLEEVERRLRAAADAIADARSLVPAKGKVA